MQRWHWEAAQRCGILAPTKTNHVLLTTLGLVFAGGAAWWLAAPAPLAAAPKSDSKLIERGRHLVEHVALCVDTAQGLVILTSCGHSGVVLIVEQARNTVRPGRVPALIGGIHLFRASK